MFSSELADKVKETVELAQARVLGVGNEQYAEGEKQLFEELTLAHLLAEVEDELLDVINYAVMLRIRIDQAKKQIKEREQELWEKPEND